MLHGSSSCSTNGTLAKSGTAEAWMRAQQDALLAVAAGTPVSHLWSGLKCTARGWTSVPRVASTVLIPVQSLEILRG